MDRATSAFSSLRLNHTGAHGRGAPPGAQEGSSVQHQRRTSGRPLQISALPCDILLTAQIADMGHADAGNDAHIRPCRPRQTVDLAGVPMPISTTAYRCCFPAASGCGHSQLIVLVASVLMVSPKAAQVGLLWYSRSTLPGHAHHFGVVLAVVCAHHHHGVVAVRKGYFLRHTGHWMVDYRYSRSCSSVQWQ